MYKTLLPLVFACTAAWSTTAKADVVDCQPTRVRSSHDRVDMRCQNVNQWFIAMRTDTDADHLKEMLSLINSAILAGKSLKLYFNTVSGNGMLYAVELFS